MENEIDHTTDLPPASHPFQSKLSKKQGIIALSITLLIIVLILLFLWFSNRRSMSSRLSSTTSQTPTGQHTFHRTSQLSTAPSPAPALSVPTSWYMIKTQSYSVKVPTGWQPNAQPMQGGVSLVIRPTHAPEDPLLVVESYSPPVDLSSKIQLFQAMGLNKSSLIAANAHPVMLTGTWHTRTIDGKTISIPTQERIVFYPYKDSGFALKLYYSSPYPEQSYDMLFAKFLASFTAAH